MHGRTARFTRGIRALVRAAGGGLLAAAALACGTHEELAPEGYLKVVRRFAASPEGGPPRDANAAPTASLLDVTRYVLAAPHPEIIVAPIEVAPEKQARTFTLEPVLPPTWQGVERIVAMPQLSIDGHTRQLPIRVVSTERGPQHTRARIKVEVPENANVTQTFLSVSAYPIGLVELASLPVPALEIPAGAVLEFSLGVIEARTGFDPVDFEVKACREKACQSVFQERFDPKAADGVGWRNRRVSLAALAGSEQQLVFEARRARDEAPFSFPVWANPTLYAPAPRPAGDANVILLSIDTLRADHLTPYGYARDTSPFLAERFGRHGTVFENPVASSTLTTPSHASMFTSLQPVTHGMTTGMSFLDPKLTTLAEAARSGGIKTGAITENGWLSANFGFARGFDSFRENRSSSLMFAAGQVDVTFANARSWLRANRDKRFFLFLHTFQVHSPYAPPERYRSLFREHAGQPIDESTPSHLRAMANYDREIRYTDDELRELFASLDELGLGENTIFIVTSDHGEAFLEHGLLEHGGFLTREMVRVPLMFWGPGIPEGRRIASPVSHVDLMPTILELLGLPAPAVTHGTSLVAQLRAPTVDGDFGTRPVFSESPTLVATGPDHGFYPFQGPAYLVRQGQRKLARYPTDSGVSYHYYDLADDPLEQRNLYPTRAAEAADLLALLESNVQSSEALRRRVFAGAEPNDTQERHLLLDPDQEAKLRALGYLDSPN